MWVVRKLVITGGAACGKSWATRWLEEQSEGQIARFDADQSVHQLVQKEGNKQKITDRFGKGVVNEHGQIERKALGARVFESSADRQWLEALIHPQVAQQRDEFISEIEQETDRKIHWIVAEIPVWFEAEVAWPVDLVVVIGADPKVQAERLRRERGLSQKGIIDLLDSQWSSVRKATQADLVCWNDGSLASFERQLQQLFGILSPPKQSNFQR